MICVVCKHGETINGTATITLVRGTTTVVMKDVPALVCDNCGEEYVGEDATSVVLKLADQAAETGVEVDVRRYVA